MPADCKPPPMSAPTCIPRSSILSAAALPFTIASLKMYLPTVFRAMAPDAATSPLPATAPAPPVTIVAAKLGPSSFRMSVKAVTYGILPPTVSLNALFPSMLFCKLIDRSAA